MCVVVVALPICAHVYLYACWFKSVLRRLTLLLNEEGAHTCAYMYVYIICFLYVCVFICGERVTRDWLIAVAAMAKYILRWVASKWAPVLYFIALTSSCSRGWVSFVFGFFLFFYTNLFVCRFGSFWRALFATSDTWLPGVLRFLSFILMPPTAPLAITCLSWARRQQ